MIVELRKHGSYTLKAYHYLNICLIKKYFPKYEINVLHSELMGDDIKHRFIKWILDIPDEHVKEFKKEYEEIFYEIRKVSKKNQKLYLKEEFND